VKLAVDVFSCGVVGVQKGGPSAAGGVDWQMKHLLLVVALVAGMVATAGSATAATTPKAYPGRDGLIAFHRGVQIYTISPNGSGLKQLTRSGQNFTPVWNPAGTEIAYEHESPGHVWNIWVMRANGSDKRQWTNTGTTYGSPAWSPSGKTLLFTTGGQWGTLETTSGTQPLQPSHALYGYNQDDNATYTVLQGNNPSWTTGNIAFTASPGTADVCYPPGGSSLMGEMCIDVYDTRNKDFSTANGVPVATQCPSYGGASNIGLVNWARWAPDSSNLLFQYKMWNSDCTASPSSVSGTYHAVASQPGDQNADYSPDGTHIVLTNVPPGQQGNIIIESNSGSNRRTLTQGYQPNWQPVH